MAQAYKCDLCGKFYEGRRTKQIVFGMTPSDLNEHIDRYDICLDCADSFNLWKESRNPDHKTAFEDKEDPTMYGNLFDGD